MFHEFPFSLSVCIFTLCIISNSFATIGQVCPILHTIFFFISLCSLECKNMIKGVKGNSNYQVFLQIFDLSSANNYQS